MILEKVEKFINEVNQSNSGTYKKQVLQKYFDEDFKKFFSYIFDFDKQFNVTSKSILKFINNKDFSGNDLFSNNNKYNNLFDLLDALNIRIITGHNAIKACIQFINDNIQYKDLILKIIDKKLDIGISETTINKLFPNTIKEFGVALANKWTEKFPLDENWVIEQKFDGIRIICIFHNKNNIEFYSRAGKQIKTLDFLKEDILKLNLPDNTVLDGEICKINNDNQEDFQGIISYIHKGIKKC